MKTKTLVKAGLILGGCALVYGIVDHYKKDYDRGEIMLKVAPGINVSETGLEKGLMGIPEIDALSERYGIEEVTPVFGGLLPEGYDGELARWYHLEFDEDANVEDMVKEYRDLGNLVEAAQLDMLYKADGQGGVLSQLATKFNWWLKGPNDPLWEKQWGMHQMQVLEARQQFEAPKKNPLPIIAVLDTGVYPHEDLEGRFAMKDGKVLGYNAIKNNDKWQDDNMHGTHVATTMAMVWNNNKGGAGVTHGLIMPVKFLSSWGSGTSEDAAKGLIWAANNGAFTINNSWGSSFPAAVLKDAGEYCTEKGVLLTAAAGNSNTDKRHYPSGYPEFLSVGALTIDGKRASFSNYGPDVEIAAPGKDIWAGVLDNKYSSLSGTSMADPFVTAAAGEVKYFHPKATNEEVRKLIVDLNSCDKIETDKPVSGKRVNLLKLLKNADKTLED